MRQGDRRSGAMLSGSEGSSQKWGVFLPIQERRSFMPSQSNVTRRDFLKKSAKTTAGLAMLRTITFLARPERVFGANDRVRVAVCGLHGRGKDHLGGFS